MCVGLPWPIPSGSSRGPPEQERVPRDHGTAMGIQLSEKSKVGRVRPKEPH